MKTTAILSALALTAASTTHASLTPHNATYDRLQVHVQIMYSTVAELLVNEELADIKHTYTQLYTEVDEALALANYKFPYYADRLQMFFETAAKESPLKNLKKQYDSYKAAPSAVMAYAARPYLDATLDMIEATLKELKNDKLVKWHNEQRKAFEKLVNNGASAALLTMLESEYLTTLADDDEAGEAVANALKEVFETAKKQYEIVIE